MQTFVQLVHAELDAVHREYRKMLRDTLAPGKIEQRRHQLPPGQVARSAEDDEHVWFELIVRIHSRPPFELPLQRDSSVFQGEPQRPSCSLGQASAISRGGAISTFVCSRTLSASRILMARSSVIPKYSFRSSRDTCDSCTPRRLASSRCEIP